MKYQLGDTDAKFAQVIWDHEPIASGELVKQCEKELNWKRSTTYTVLKKLSDRGFFKNENSIVTSLISREEFDRRKSEEFIEEEFDGSLPKFLTAFMQKKKMSQKQVEELKTMIENYRG